MFAVSPRWARTVRQSHRVSIDAVAYQAPRNGAPSTPTPVAVSEWSLTASTTARSRYELTATIIPSLEDVIDAQMGYWLDLHATVWHDRSTTERIPLCVCRIQDSERDVTSPAWSVTALSCEALQDDNKFLLPFTPNARDRLSAKNLMTYLLVQGAGEQLVPVRDLSTVPDARVPVVTWDQDRWAAVDGEDDSLGTALGVDVYSARDLAFIIADKAPDEPDPVWDVSTGADGVQVSRRETTSRSGVFNHVIVQQEATTKEDGTQTTARVRVYGQDLLPTSPTRIGGPFGRVTGDPIYSPLATTTVIAQRMADQAIAAARGKRASVSLSMLPNLALDPGDAIAVTTDKGRQLHVIDSYQVSGNADGVGAMSCETRIVREEL